jgi:hypothetical protein
VSEIPAREVRVGALNNAAPQLIISSRPSGSAAHSLRSASACTLICWPPAVNRQGWVLCTDGAQTASATMYLTISSAVIGSLIQPAHLRVRGKMQVPRSVCGGTFGRPVDVVPFSFRPVTIAGTTRRSAAYGAALT